MLALLALASPVVLPALLLVGAVLCGSFPTGVLLARAKGVDLRKVGSGNVGASNVGRALGKGWGLFVLLVDAGKGALPVALARAWEASPWVQAAVALAAVVGHVFSIFLRGKGGKGVATALGAALALTPLPAVAAFAVYAACYAAVRISSVGSLAGALSYTAFLFVLGQAHPAPLTFGLLAAAIILVRHRDNLRRLAAGKELRAP